MDGPRPPRRRELDPVMRPARVAAMMTFAFIIVGLLLLTGLVIAAVILAGLWFGTRAYEDRSQEYVRYDVASDDGPQPPG